MANKAYPLKKSSSFRKVAQNSKKLRLSKWLTLQVMPSGDSNNYVGITVSGKVANSVVRNKLKRWVKNCVQSEKWPEKYNACIFVFVFKPQAEPKFFSNLQYKEFKELFISLNS
ncbi:MAG: ribonuclease P protein component [Pseudobdellovibrio sp.]